MLRVALIFLLVVVAGLGGYLIGMSQDEHTTTRIIREAKPGPSPSEQRREQFGIPSNEESCRQFGISQEACPE